MPDATFIAVPNHEVAGVASALASRDAGGFVCFSAGFAEAGSDLGRRLTEQLIKERRRPALLRSELLRLCQFLRSGCDDARSNRGRTLGSGRGSDLPKRHHRTHLDVQ